MVLEEDTRFPDPLAAWGATWIDGVNGNAVLRTLQMTSRPAYVVELRGMLPFPRLGLDAPNKGWGSRVGTTGRCPGGSHLNTGCPG